MAYLDSDNAWDKNYLQIMLGSLLETGKKTAYCGIVIYNSKNEQHKLLLHEHYDRSDLEISNFIDLNAFMHHRSLFESMGGFDETLTRLVDWDLILRYTKDAPPEVVSSILVDYYLVHGGNHLTYKENFYPNYYRIQEKNRTSI